MRRSASSSLNCSSFSPLFTNMIVPPKLPDVRFPPVGKCIYCGTTIPPLDEEHVIPLSFGGHRILPKASCRDCGAVTGADEGHCAGRMFGALKLHHKIRGRKRKTKTKHVIVLDGNHPQGAPAKAVAGDEAPGIVVFPILAPPRILLGLPASDRIDLLGFHWWTTTEDARERQQRLVEKGFVNALAFSSFELIRFLRVLAKIAHGYDVANVGLKGSDDTLTPYILRNNLNISYVVGGTPPNGTLPILLQIPHADTGLHQIAPFNIVINSKPFIGVQIRLFSYLKPAPPIYTVIMRPHAIPHGDFYFSIMTQ